MSALWGNESREKPDFCLDVIAISRNQVGVIISRFGCSSGIFATMNDVVRKLSLENMGLIAG